MAKTEEANQSTGKQVAELTAPVFFNNYEQFPDQKVPLGQLGVFNLYSLYSSEATCISARARAVCAAMDSEENLCSCMVLFETTEGIFCRTLEKEAKREVNHTDFSFTADVYWMPIEVGRPVTILNTFIVYKDQMLARVPAFTNLSMGAGDVLNVRYRLTTLPS